MSGRDGMLCGYCGEPIRADDPVGRIMPLMHFACSLRLLCGGANHIRKLCTCYDGTLDGDPEGLTRREAAVQAMLAWMEMRRADSRKVS